MQTVVFRRIPISARLMIKTQQMRRNRSDLIGRLSVCALPTSTAQHARPDAANARHKPTETDVAWKQNRS